MAAARSPIRGSRRGRKSFETSIAVSDPITDVDQNTENPQLVHGRYLFGLERRSLDAIRSIDLPLAGALAHEGVANRTLLVGPAGGFYSACTEDIYPNCWSAIYAADSLKKALKEPHLQDALQAYRHRWRTTLGGPLCPGRRRQTTSKTERCKGGEPSPASG